jgi:hypothetical protein
MDAVAHLAPFLNWPRQLEYLRAADRAVESNPRHRLGMREVLSATADFPQTLVRLVPDAGKVQQKFALHGPALFVSAKSALPRLMQRVHDLAKNIELKLVMRSVADTHRLRIFIAGKPGHFPFGQAPLAAQAVHDLDLARASRGGTQQPFAPVFRFVVITGIHQRQRR